MSYIELMRAGSVRPFTDFVGVMFTFNCAMHAYVYSPHSQRKHAPIIRAVALFALLWLPAAESVQLVGLPEEFTMIPNLAFPHSIPTRTPTQALVCRYLHGTMHGYEWYGSALLHVLDFQMYNISQFLCCCMQTPSFKGHVRRDFCCRVAPWKTREAKDNHH